MRRYGSKLTEKVTGLIKALEGEQMGRKYKDNYNEFYHSKEWQAVRQHVLQRDNYLCQVCKRAGRITPATTVHHIKAVRVDYSKRLDPNNLETICKACHNAEHNERTKSLHDKQTKLKAEKNSDIFTFKANPEL